MSNLLMLLAVLCLFGACKGSGNYEPINNKDLSTADVAAADSTESKLVKTAEMNMKLRMFQQ